jgi:hypothetical protein
MLPLPMLVAAGAATQLTGAPAAQQQQLAATPSSSLAAAPHDAVVPVSESLLGRAVRREFAAGFFNGTVVSARSTDTFGTLFKLVYADGDEEELGWTDLQCWLLPAPPSAAAQPVAARAALATASAAAAAPPPDARAAPSSAVRAAPPAAVRASIATDVSLPSVCVPSTAAAAAPAQRKFKGVNRCKTGRWRMFYEHGGESVELKDFPDAESAAREYDTHMRRLGNKVVNFPREQPGEVQAVFGENNRVTLRRAAGSVGAAAAAAAAILARPPPPKPKPKRKLATTAVAIDAAAGYAHLSIYDRLKLGLRTSQATAPPPPSARRPHAGGAASAAAAPKQLKKPPHMHDAVAPPAAAPQSRFYGVRVVQLKGSCRFEARCSSVVADHDKPKQITIGSFATEEAAARAYDAAARAHGALRRLNFPVTPKEKAAVADFQRQKEKRRAAGSGSSAAVARAPQQQPQPIRKRGLSAVVQPARKLARMSTGAARGEAAAANAVLRHPVPPVVRHTPSSELGRVEAFLRSIVPPLVQARWHRLLHICMRVSLGAILLTSDARCTCVCCAQIEAIVAALPSSGLTMAHLTRAAEQSNECRELCIVTAARGLCIVVPGDKMFFLALDKLHRAAAGTAGGA